MFVNGLNFLLLEIFPWARQAMKLGNHHHYRMLLTVYAYCHFNLVIWRQSSEDCGNQGSQPLLKSVVSFWELVFGVRSLVWNSCSLFVSPYLFSSRFLVAFHPPHHLRLCFLPELHHIRRANLFPISVLVSKFCLRILFPTSISSFYISASSSLLSYSSSLELAFVG